VAKFAPEFSPETAALLKNQPNNSPPVISAWLANQFADQLIVAFRTLDRRAAESEAQRIAYDLQEFAMAAEPDRPPESTSDASTRLADSEERQGIYSTCSYEDRIVLFRLLARRPVVGAFMTPRTAAYVLRDLRSRDLVAGEELTPRGLQIAQGLKRSNARLYDTAVGLKPPTQRHLERLAHA
jgi:hypothetical protein